MYDFQENRIDGGSDSPSPADDEIHSNSDAGGHNDSFNNGKTIGDIIDQELRVSLSMRTMNFRHKLARLCILSVQAADPCGEICGSAVFADEDGSVSIYAN